MKDYNKSELYLIGYLADKGVTIKGNEVKDFGLDGDEDETDVEQYANDYLSDLATERAEYESDSLQRYDEQHEQDVYNTEAGQHMARGYSEGQ